MPALAWAGGRWTLLAAPVTVAAALLDGLDGAVAVLQERVTPWGAVLDAVADRLSDLLFLGALGVAGAPPALCAAGAVPMFLLEYLRARAIAAGMTEIGTVTVWERATRVVVTTGFLLGAGLYVGQARRWASLGAAAWVGLGITGCAQLTRVVRQRLR